MGPFPTRNNVNLLLSEGRGILVQCVLCFVSSRGQPSGAFLFWLFFGLAETASALYLFQHCCTLNSFFFFRYMFNLSSRCVDAGHSRDLSLHSS